MGLFSFVGNLLGGGGGTQVSQQAANTSTTTVDVGIENKIDLGPIAAVLEWLGLRDVEEAKANRETQEAIALKGSMDAQAVLAALQEGQKAEVEQRQKVIESVTPWFKLTALAGILLMGTIAAKQLKVI